jgi:glycolate oxidase
MTTSKNVVQRDFAKALASAIGTERVREEDFVLESYTQDSSHVLFPSKRPAVVVMPSNTEDVQKIVKLANEFFIPITPCGGRTSTWGALQCEDRILIDTSNMNKILEIDEQNMTVTGQCGVPVRYLDQELRKKGYCLPTHPLHSGANTLGSEIAKDTGGTYGGLFGHAARRVVGLEVVLGNGEILQTGACRVVKGLPKYIRSGLPDLTGVFVASEGALGVITEVSIEIIRAPVAHVYMDYIFPRTDEGVINLVKALHEIKIKGIGYTVYFVDDCMASYMTRGLVGGSPDEWGEFKFNNHWAMASVYSLFSRTECEEREKEARTIFEKYGGQSAGSMMMTLADAPEYKWDEFPKMAFGLRQPWMYIWADLPWFSVLEAYKRCQDVISKFDWPKQRAGFITSFSYESCQPMEFIFMHPGDQEEIEKAREISKELMKNFLDVGGIPYRVGSMWRPYFLEMLDSQYFKYMQSIKRLFDPNNIMNPGVSIF